MLRRAYRWSHERPDVPYEIHSRCTYCQSGDRQLLPNRASSERRWNLVQKVGKFPFRVSGKAIVAHETTGFVKVLLQEHGEVLVHTCGHGATEMIHELVLARTLEATEKDILHTVHAHPTLGGDP